MKLTSVITLGAVFVLLASVYVLNRPQLTTIDAAIPQNFPGHGFSHEVCEQLLQTYLDGAGTEDIHPSEALLITSPALLPSRYV